MEIMSPKTSGSVSLPARYIEIRKTIPVDEISYGIDRIKLFPVAELEHAQVGYSTPDGKSLCGDKVQKLTRFLLVHTPT